MIIGTALCTPVFPAIGFVNICLRFALPDPQLRRGLSSSLGSILSFACWTIIPYSYEIAPLLLPFAISNGISAGIGYAFLDITSGGPRSSSFLKNPILTGGGIGAFTGIIAPRYLYGEAYDILYGIENVTPLMKEIMSWQFVTEISCSTGFIAGCAMYPLLHYPIFGYQRLPWTKFSGLLLMSSFALMYSVYRIDDEKHGMLTPEGSYVKPEMSKLLNSLMRLNVQTMEFEMYSLTTNSWVGSPELYQEVQIIVKSVRNYQRWNECTFDNPLLALLYLFIDKGIAMRFSDHLVTIEDTKELIRKRDQMHKTDLSVAFIIERSKNQGSNLVQIVSNFLISTENFTLRKSQRLLNATEKASLGIELVMIMKQCGMKEIHLETSNNTTISLGEIENWIRKTVPGIILYKTEETAFTQGMSVEAQLDLFSWVSTDLSTAFKRWEHDFVEEERNRKRFAFAIASGLLATICSGILYAY